MTGEKVAPLHGLTGVPDVTGDHLNAQRFLDAYGSDLRRSPELGRWYIWNGSWWEEDRLDRVLELAADVIDGLRRWVAEADSPDEFKRRSAHYAASAKAGRHDALLSVAGHASEIVVSVTQLDAHPHLLACRNGTVDLTTGELRAPDRAHLLTRGVAVDYDADAFSERFVAFLDEVFAGDSELIAYVQRLLGYCITGEVRDHVLPVWWGAGANGKSTLLGATQDLLGDLAISAPEGLIIRRDHEPHPERMAALRGRRLVVSSELEQRAVLAEAIVKLLTGGDTISARELYGRRFNFKPSHKVVLVSNHRPRVHGTDHAMWRRLRVVPFTVTIPPERQDPALRRRLVEEDGPAVLAWLVAGAVAWHHNGLGDVPAVVEATEDYRTSQDTFGAWLSECTVAVERAPTKVGDLWSSWKTWTERAGEQPGRLQDFRAALDEHGFVVTKYEGTAFVRAIGLVRGAAEGLPGTLPISTSTKTLRTSPHEPPGELFEDPDDAPSGTGQQ